MAADLVQYFLQSKCGNRRHTHLEPFVQAEATAGVQVLISNHS